MKQKFSTKWISSKQPRKQRKYLANAPLHIRKKFVSASLNPVLKKKYGRRSFGLRKGDEVKIMVGEFKGKTGKIEVSDLKKRRVSLTGINRSKNDGTKVAVYFDPSNLQIQSLNLEDKKRIKSLERKNEIKPIKKTDEKMKFKKLPTEAKENVSE